MPTDRKTSRPPPRSSPPKAAGGLLVKRRRNRVEEVGGSFVGQIGETCIKAGRRTDARDDTRTALQPERMIADGPARYRPFQTANGCHRRCRALIFLGRVSACRFDRHDRLARLGTAVGAPLS